MNQPQHTELVIENPLTGQRIDIAPLLTYLSEQTSGAVVASPDGAHSVQAILRRVNRYIAVTPLNLDQYTPGEVASLHDEIYRLEDLFGKLTQVPAPQAA